MVHSSADSGAAQRELREYADVLWGVFLRITGACWESCRATVGGRCAGGWRTEEDIITLSVVVIKSYVLCMKALGADKAVKCPQCAAIRCRLIEGLEGCTSVGVSTRADKYWSSHLARHPQAARPYSSLAGLQQLGHHDIELLGLYTLLKDHSFFHFRVA